MKQAIPEGQTCPAATCNYALNTSRAVKVASKQVSLRYGALEEFKASRVDSSGPIVGPYKQKPRSLEQDLAAVLRLETHSLQLRVSLLIAGLAPAILLLLQREYFFERGSCY